MLRGHRLFHPPSDSGTLGTQGMSRTYIGDAHNVGKNEHEEANFSGNC